MYGRSSGSNYQRIMTTTTHTKRKHQPALAFLIQNKRSSFLLRLVVLHIRSGRVELEVTLDDLVDCSQKVLFSGDLSPRADSKHASLCRHTPELSTCAVGAKTGDEFPTDIALYAHALCMDAKNVCTALHVWE